MSLTATYKLEADLDGDASGVFEEDWTAYLLEAHINRGRSDSLAPMEASRATFVLNNQDGRFSPDKGTYADLDHMGRVIFYQLTPLTNYIFGGYITDFWYEPEISSERAVIECSDLLGIADTILVGIGLIDGKTGDLILHRILDQCEEGDVITNFGFEVDTTGWSAIAGSAISRVTAAASVFEGAGAGQCITPGSVTGEGLAYDVTSLCGLGTSWRGGIYVKAPNGATLCLQNWDDYAGVYGQTDFTGTGDWQYVDSLGGIPMMIFPNNGSTSRAIRIVTRISAQALSFQVDDLHLAPFRNRIPRSFQTGQTALTRVSFDGESALEAIRKVVDSEPGWFWFQPDSEGGTVLFKNNAYAPALELTFSDDGANNPHQGLRIGYGIADRISQVQVNCRSAEYEESTAVIVWRYKTSVTVPAGQTRYIPVSKATASVSNTIVALPAKGSCTATFEETTIGGGYHGVGGYRTHVIKLVNGAGTAWAITDLHVEGKPITSVQGGGEAVYTYQPTGAVRKGNLTLDMPFALDTDAIVATAATAAGDKYVDLVRRPEISVMADTNAYLNTLLDLDLRDRVRIINDDTAYSLNLDKNVWVEGVDIDLLAAGKFVTFTFHTEEV